MIISRGWQAQEREALKIFNVLVIILGLIFVGLGLYLGVGKGDPLGGMVGLSVGVATIALGAYIFEDKF